MLVDVVVQQSAYHIVRRGYGVEIAGKVQVYLLHREYLSISSAGSAALYAKAGAK